MYFLTLIGLILRISFINKPEGLWNDEYVSWMVASTPFGNGFWQEVLKQCHMPLYYLYLKPFSHCSDLVLRLTSVIPSIAAIPVMYLVGKEHSKKTGYIAASITSILSFLIYYSQEVRFYSLLFLFSALSLLFTFRLLKKVNKHNIAGYIISNILILCTHVLGFIYVFLNLIYTGFKKKYLSKKILISILSIIVLLTPIGINILKQLPSSQWWGHFTYTNILFLFSDFLSPILTNNVNAPNVFFYNIHLTIWLTIPTVVGVFGLIYGIKNYKGISIISILTIIIMSIISYCGKLVFITKYAIEILPIFIFLIAVGYSRLKKIGLTLLGIFIAFHFAGVFTPYYVTKLQRSEGHKIVAEIIKARKPEVVLFTYYEPNRFYRYIDLKNMHTLFISKINRLKYKNYPKNILKNIHKNTKISVIFLDSVSFLPEKYLAVNNKNVPEMFATFSHIRNELIEYLDTEYKDFYVDTIGSWTVITAIKK